MRSPIEALEFLLEGNRRFASGTPRRLTQVNQKRARTLGAGQEPFAIIVGCSDSRVPPEIIFDQGLGDLFVIRVAGNVVGPSQLESATFAVTHLGTRLIVVLGHTDCAAIGAALKEFAALKQKQTPDLPTILNRMRPSLNHLLEGHCHQDPRTLKYDATRLNVLASTQTLRQATPALQELTQSGELLVLGAEYSIETGIVDFFDGLPKEVS